jgi:hypothetical protein
LGAKKQLLKNGKEQFDSWQARGSRKFPKRDGDNGRKINFEHRNNDCHIWQNVTPYL